MSLLVTRKGSACTTREGADGKTEYVEVLEVSGPFVGTTDAAIRDEAIAACPARNDAHPQNSLALRRDASASGKAPKVTVTLIYAIPAGGSWDPITPTNPWEKPWRVTVSPITDREPFAVTADGKAAHNTAGDVFDDPLEDEPDGLLIEVEGYFRDVDTYLRKLAKYRKTVNSEDFEFSPGGSTGTPYLIVAEEMKCLSVYADPYDLGSTAPLHGGFRFEWRPAPFDRTAPENSGRKWYPHQARRRNQGRRAWWTDGSQHYIDVIVDKDGVAVSQDVDLLEDGSIADGWSYFVGIDKHASAPAPSARVKPAQFDVETSGPFGDYVTFIYLRKCLGVSFENIFGSDEFLPPPPPPPP